jgi:hypothetical protein
VRVVVPDGSEPRVGVCDTEGNVTVLATTNVTTAPLQVLNVRDFGAIPDDDSAAAKAANSQSFKDAQETIGRFIDGVFYGWGLLLDVPPGRYFLDDHVLLSARSSCSNRASSASRSSSSIGASR